VVVDTNVFVSGVINANGPPGQRLDRWRTGRFELLLSDAQFRELSGVLDRPKIVRRARLSLSERIGFLERLGAATRVIPRSVIPVVVRDPKDVKILAAALGGDADYLVTGDNDLLEHQGDPRLGVLQIVTVVQFLDVPE
jgi:putative PIN family toxin of toxin-antitoxin system